VIASDVRYFELGARIEPVAGARLAWVPGFADLAAGCVVTDAAAWCDGADPGLDLEACEHRVRALGGRLRLYLRGRAPVLESVMRRRGYASREEICFVLHGPVAASCPVAIEPVEDADAWETKRVFHARNPDSPDGHEAASARRLELERRKVETGGMRAWLIRDAGDGEVAGTVCTLEHGEILRLKNLLVARDRRRRGIGTSAVAALAATAGRSGRTLGVVALADAPSAAMYRRPEALEVARWIEWIAPLHGAGSLEAR
jgi:hypothetical protein